jgi:hypothetical protein
MSESSREKQPSPTMMEFLCKSEQDLLSLRHFLRQAAEAAIIAHFMSDMDAKRYHVQRMLEELTEAMKLLRRLEK